jgi:hypothetical protein
VSGYALHASAGQSVVRVSKTAPETDFHGVNDARRADGCLEAITPETGLLPRVKNGAGFRIS